MKAAALPMLTAIAISGAASAQDVGKFGQNQRVVLRYDETSRVAKCVVDKDRSSAATFVAQTDIGKRPSKKIDAALRECIRGSSLTMHRIELRGLLAEQILLDESDVTLSRVSSMQAAVPRRLAAEDGNIAEVFFDCVVAAQPAASVAMLKTGRGSPQEYDAFMKIAPALQGCAPLEGSVPLKRDQVRGLIAISLYRQSVGGAGVK